ncbi:MAG: S8 family peptidase [Candidatus Calescibacterium sp.]
MGEIEFLSEKEKVGVLLQAKVPAGTSEEIKQIVSELRNFDVSIRAFPNMRMRPNAVLDGRIPLDPLFDSWEETPGGNNWHFEALNMPGLWKMETEGKVPVAVIDFGIKKHEDLEYDLRRGVDGEGADWAQNHGVSVLGVLGAVGNNSKGIAGVIWRGDIEAYLIDGTLSGLVQRIVLALQDEAKVILFAGGLEWGNVKPVGNPEAEAILEYHRQIFSIVFQYVRYYDALFVQSAGNENQDAYWSGVGASVKDLFPHNILLVGSTNILGKISSFSNKGSLVDIYLPGENIFTTCAGEGGNNNSDSRYCSVSGTSYSAALGAGVAVLLRSINQNLRSGDIKNLILSGVRVEDEGYEARYFIDFSISANNALQAIPSETDVFSEPFPELPFILKGGFLAPKAVACAVYDNTTEDGDKAYNTPKCRMDEDGCSSCGLLDGIGSSEPNFPNVIAGTRSGADQPGADPVRIISIQIDSLAESGFIEPGKNIKVFVRAWCNNTNQWVDMLTSPNPDAASPTFLYLGSWRCDCGASNGWTSSSIVGSVVCGKVASGSGYEVSIRFVITLPTVLGKMAIRARIQNSGAAQTAGCYTTSSIRDHDDLVFTIQNPPSGFSCGVYNSSF